MRDEDGGQLRQTRSVGAQRFVGGFCGIGAGSRSYQLSPIVGNDEIVFRELETRESIHPTRNDLRNEARRKSVPRQRVFRKRRRKDNRFVEILVAALAEVILRFGL